MQEIEHSWNQTPNTQTLSGIDKNQPYSPTPSWTKTTEPLSPWIPITAPHIGALSEQTIHYYISLEGDTFIIVKEWLG